jgi:hypothetical protein
MENHGPGIDDGLIISASGGEFVEITLGIEEGISVLLVRTIDWQRLACMACRSCKKLLTTI